MKFRVSKDTDVICVGCEGTTRCVIDNIYNTDHLACNCDVEQVMADIDNPPPFSKEMLEAPEDGSRQAGLDELNELDPQTDTDDAEFQEEDDEMRGEHKDQAKMFEDPPENIIDPAETDMDQHQARLHLESLGWQALLKAAKANGVKKSPKDKTPELIEKILAEVFGEAGSDEL